MIFLYDKILNKIIKNIYNKYLKKTVTKVKIPIMKKIALNELNNLQKLIKENKIDNRSAYYNLSRIIRLFTKRITNIDFTSMSLKEIKKTEMHDLADLMEEYYMPEFSKQTQGDILTSINKTREVILSWKK
jgi:hypothetical protein